MEYSKLGQSDLDVSRIGFGCWAIGGHGYGDADDARSVAAIHKALDLGINFFDTADVYGFGHSEEILSTALGNRRKDVIIATKFGVAWDARGKTYKDSNPERLVEALDASLRRLKIDCIPLYQIHHFDGKTNVEDTMEALLRCQEKGKIKYIGCCNFPMDIITAAKSVGNIVSLQAQFNLIERENEVLLRDCQSIYQMGTIIYGALMRGLFSGGYREESIFGKNDTRSVDKNFSGTKLAENLRIVDKMKELSGYYNKSSVQVALRWILDSSFITSIIVGAKSAEQVAGNVEAIGWRLQESHWKELSELKDKS